MSTAFDGYIGQESLIRTLKKFLSKEEFPHIFLSATMGAGKTDLAKRVANAIDRPFKEISCRSGFKLDAFIYKIHLTWKDGGVLFLDELPLLSKSHQASLRTLLSAGEYTTQDGDVIVFKNITVIAASSDITKVDTDLLDRFEILEFEPYTHDDLVLIGQTFDNQFETNLEYPVIESLAWACNYSPRKLKKLIQNAADAVIRSGDKPTIENILETARIDRDGMTTREIEVLIRIGTFLSNDVNPTVSRLATALRVSERSMRAVFESLEAYGYISVSMGPGGRKLTMDGISKYKELQN